MMKIIRSARLCRFAKQRTDPMIRKDVWQKCDEWLSNGNTGVFRYEINP